MTVDVVAAIIRDNQKILITQRFDHVHLPGLWEFPGGKVEPDESLTAALEREIREEPQNRSGSIFSIAPSSMANPTRWRLRT